MIGPGGSRQREFEEETGPLLRLRGRRQRARSSCARCAPRAPATRSSGPRSRCRRATRSRSLIDEPHMYVEEDAVGRLESGYVVVVAGSGPYVGQRHKVRIERATRFSAYATLVDAPPVTDHGAGSTRSRTSSSPSARSASGSTSRAGCGASAGAAAAAAAAVAVAVAVAGSVPTGARPRAANGAKPPVTEEAVAASLPEPDELTGVPVSASDAEDADKDADAAAKRRRRRRGGRGRGRKPRRERRGRRRGAASEDVGTPVAVGGAGRTRTTTARRASRRRPSAGAGAAAARPARVDEAGRRPRDRRGPAGRGRRAGTCRGGSAADPQPPAGRAARVRPRRPHRHPSRRLRHRLRPPEPAKSGGLLGRLFGRREPLAERRGDVLEVRHAPRARRRCAAARGRAASGTRRPRPRAPGRSRRRRSARRSRRSGARRRARRARAGARRSAGRPRPAAPAARARPAQERQDVDGLEQLAPPELRGAVVDPDPEAVLEPLRVRLGVGGGAAGEGELELRVALPLDDGILDPRRELGRRDELEVAVQQRSGPYRQMTSRGSPTCSPVKPASRPPTRSAKARRSPMTASSASSSTASTTSRSENASIRPLRQEPPIATPTRRGSRTAASTMRSRRSSSAARWVAASGSTGADDRRSVRDQPQVRDRDPRRRARHRAAPLGARRRRGP